MISELNMPESESEERVILAAEEPLFVEDETYTGAEEKPAELLLSEVTAAGEDSKVLEIHVASPSELSEKDDIIQRDAAVDKASLSRSEPEAVLESEQEDAEGETAAAGPVSNLDVKKSDDNVQRSEVHWYMCLQLIVFVYTFTLLRQSSYHSLVSIFC